MPAGTGPVALIDRARIVVARARDAGSGSARINRFVARIVALGRARITGMAAGPAAARVDAVAEQGVIARRSVVGVSAGVVDFLADVVGALVAVAAQVGAAALARAAAAGVVDGAELTVVARRG